MTALVSGEIQVMFVTTPLGIPHIEAKRIRPLAYTGPKRAAFMPDVPTIAEAGAPGATMDNMSWYGVFGPAKLPAKITTQLHKEFAAALKLPLIVERLDNLRLVPVGDSPKDFAAFMEGELKRFAEMVKLSGYQPE
jgi:tripartite-type tricarboxylate transporter receptor subunit TctC